MAKILPPPVTFHLEELRDVSVVRFAGYFSFPGVLHLTALSFVRALYGARIPVSKTHGLGSPGLCAGPSMGASPTRCGRKAGGNRSFLLGN